MDGTAQRRETTGTLPARGRALIPPLRLIRPRTPQEAAAALSEPGAVAMAGGVEVIAGLKSGGMLRTLVLLRGVQGLCGIVRDEGGLRIGALATHEAIARDPLVRASLPGFAAIWAGIANVRIRRQGTLVGCALTAMPHYDAPPALSALGATALCLTEAGEEEMPLGRARGLVLALRLPAGQRFAHDRSLRPALLVSAALAVEAGIVRSARLALAGAHRRSVATTITEAEGLATAALRRHARELAGRWAAALPSPDHQPSGTPSPAWRLRAAEVLSARLLESLADG